LVKRRNKSAKLGKFIINTLLLVVCLVIAVVYGPIILRKISYHTPNYRAFGVSVPAGYPITGIDVSRYQGKVDWGKVKEMRSGKLKVNFVFAKATEGLSSEDSYFDRNQKQCAKHDIPFGAYHYFIPSLDAIKQADFFVSKYKPKKGNLPPVADIEKTFGLSGPQIRKYLKVFLDRVEAKSGVKPIIYTYHSFYRDYLSEGFDGYTFWLAHYGPGKPHDQPWTFWQFSEKSTISGINHLVDLNVFKGDSAAFEELRVK